MPPIKIGVIGCGAIAQVHHMPNLTDLPQLFQVTAVCDVSEGAVNYIGDRFHVAQRFTNYRDLLATDVEAVLLCQSDPKTQVAIDSFDAGKHVSVEKPVCFSLQEMDAILAAQQRAGTVGQAAYMKVYDPAFEAAKQEVDSMENVRFVQINHLHPDNSLHLKQFHLERFNDIPAEAKAAVEAARTAAVREAIGEVTPAVTLAFLVLAGSMIHDLYGLRAMMGMPERVVSTEIWQEGRALTITLAYPNGARCVASWVDLTNLWDFKETLEIYSDDKRVIVSYPTGFSRGILSAVTVQGTDANGVAYRKEPAVDWESAFTREMRHFYRCVREGAQCRTPLTDARLDVGLIIQMIERYLGK